MRPDRLKPYQPVQKIFFTKTTPFTPDTCQSLSNIILSNNSFPATCVVTQCVPSHGNSHYTAFNMVPHST